MVVLTTYAKLGVNDRAAAVAAAFDRGLLTPAAASEPTSPFSALAGLRISGLFCAYRVI